MKEENEEKLPQNENYESKKIKPSLMSDLKDRQNKKYSKTKEKEYKKRDENITVNNIYKSKEKIMNQNEESKENYNQKYNNNTPLSSHRTFVNKIIVNENLNNDKEINKRKIYVDLNNFYNENKTNTNNTENKNEIINQRNLFCDNSIRTCQYTILTFFPLALLNQFKTAFNWFFLIYIIIACIPILSDKSVAAEVSPFIVVIIISLFKEAIEDYRKYINDKKSNNTPVLIYKQNRFYKDKCQSIKVGNIIKIYKDELIPADVLIVKSSLKSGLCYMQTSNLDGENALKPREAFNLTQDNIFNKSKIINKLFNYQKEHFFIEVLPPNKDIYNIEGTVFYDKNKNYISIKNILLRGARLKNVDYVYGIVLYSGHDTKLMQNIGHSSLKMSSIDIKLNYIILIIFIICIIINIISSLLGISIRESLLPNYDEGDINAEYVLYYRDKETRKNYLEIIRIITNNFLIYNTFIPISIIISNAFCKILQTIYLQQFSPEYKEDKDDKIKCFSTGLLDELGNVKYIFSDKTGTLTKNEMVFRGCSIYTQLFDDSSNNNNDSMTDSFYAQSFLNLQYPNTSALSRKNISFNESTKMATNLSKLSSSKISENFGLNNFLRFLQNNITFKNNAYQNITPFNSVGEAIEHFFINIIINHDVLIEYNDKNEINFQGPSPDEITLVTAAYEFGFCFVSRENNIISIELHDQNGNIKEKQYKILQKFDFTSERQCSSIIVEDNISKRKILYIKGSDRKIFNSLDEYSLKNIHPKTKQHVDQFAKQGLRTLCYGFKYIKNNDYEKWEKEYIETKYKSMTNKELCGVLDLLINRIESNVVLLGVSALEDKLQNEVEKDIKKFIEAGINFWMITGDKMDTAESIGYSCGIFSEDCEVYKIKDTNNVQQVINTMKDISQKIDKIDYELNNITQNHHEKMVRNKIIPDDEKYRKLRKYRNRFNSFNIEINNENQNDVKNKIEGKSMNVHHKKLKENNQLNDNISQIEDKYKINPEKELEKNLKINENINSIEINDQINFHINKEKKNISQLKSLNKEKDNEYKNKQFFQLIKKTNEGSIHSKESENKIIFKYMAKNIENASGDISMIKNDVKKFRQSIKSSEIFESNENYQNMNSSNERNQKEEQKLEIKDNKNDYKENNENTKIKKYKDIPLEEKQFIEYFDSCQKELYKCAIKHSERLKIFKIKYLYPKPIDNEYNFKKIKSKFSLMLEGSAITTCMTDGEAADLFWGLIQRSRSLICCRASPSQKSQIVNFIKKKTDSITLAIGDGGNDVNMIRTSNVGIGIFGKEGYQAAYNSDYAISQFKYLKRLLFYDGRITLRRNTYFLYHYFFKNFIFTMVLFWFGLNSCFSGGNYYDDYYSMGFNSFATVVLIAVYEILHEDFDPDFSSFKEKEKNLLKNLLPDIYKQFRDSYPFNLVKFFSIFIISILLSYICYIIPTYSFTYNYYGSNQIGYQYSIRDTSFVTYISILLIHYLIIAIDTNSYNTGIIIFYIIQLIITFIFLVFCDQGNDDFEIYNSLTLMLSNANTWLTLLLTIYLCFLLFFILRRAEYFFGGFIENNIMQRNFKDYFIEKFYQKKVEQMTRVVRSVAKFKRIFYHQNEGEQDDNLADQKMRKIVDEFKIMQKNTFIKKSKSYIKLNKT